MASHIIVTCDKCSCEIVSNRLCFDVRSGQLRHRRPQVDLCTDCAKLFEAWIGVNGTPRHKVISEDVEND